MVVGRASDDHHVALTGVDKPAAESTVMIYGWRGATNAESEVDIGSSPA